MENTNYPLQEDIQALVNSELEETAKNALLEQLNTNPALVEQLAFSQSLALALRNREMVAASLILNQVIAEEGFPPPATPSYWGKWRTWAGISTLVVMMFTGSYFLAESQGLFRSESQELSRQAAKPLENVLFLPNDGDGLSDLKKGMEAYDKGDFATANQWLTAYVKLRPDNSAKVYLGIARLFAGKPKLALQPLTEASKSDEPPIQEAALWYLALAQLESSNEVAAKMTLQAIPVNGLFGDQAQELLKKLK